ncbi:MAG: hypothetical protein S4CHLAM102_00730 [Chlamydiia bacterium]|nr:hypothetical protein [Chlamydiia bacterium]
MSEKGKKYNNPHIDHDKRSWLDFVKWGLGFYKPHPEHETKVPASFTYPISPKKLDDSAPKATWLGHSTFLIEVGPLTILTDPIWSDRCSPLPFFGPIRRHPVPMTMDELPDVDVVIISHNHYDHLDEYSVLELHKRFKEIQFIVPRGVKGWFTRRGIENCQELDWWQEHQIPIQNDEILSCMVYGTPSQHNSGRSPFDRNKSLWMGAVLRVETKSWGRKQIYFVGDTGYNPSTFKAIGKQFGPMDLSCIPIGTYCPYTFMAPVHIDPVHAVDIHRDVASKLSIGMHYKTFRLSREDMDAPPYALYRAMQKKKLNPLTFLATEPGCAHNF